MKTFIIALLSIAATAQAHVEPGLYQGVDEKGAVCSLTAGATTFIDNKHHPLNERFAFDVNGAKFSAGHPVLIDAKSGDLGFNHDIAQGVLATSSGAQVLQVTILHTAAYEGPSEYLLIENDWVNKTKTTVRCSELQLHPAQ